MGAETLSIIRKINRIIKTSGEYISRRDNDLLLHLDGNLFVYHARDEEHLLDMLHAIYWGIRLKERSFNE